MQRSQNILTATVIAFLVMSVIFTPVADAFLDINLVSILKLFGLGYVVKQFGPQINDAINTLALQRKWETKDVTKVVPILSGEIGSSGVAAYIGAAQVSGPAEQIALVEAVAQVEGDFQKALRLKMLIPVDNINPLQMNRVFGVGVSAIIDITL